MSERRPLRVAFLTPGNADSMRTWSGIPYHCLQALRQCFDDVRFFPCPITHGIERAVQKLCTPLGIQLSREPLVSSLYSLELRRRLRRYAPDLVIGISSSVQLYHRLTCAPVIYMADAVYAGIVDYYPPSGPRIHPRTRRMGDWQERCALGNSDAVILCSEWAADAARQAYGVPAEKLHVVPFGANMPDSIQPTFDRQMKTCRLLFIGADWLRKGGPVVHQAVEIMRSRGIDSELHIVGCTPPIKGNHIIHHGFLHKSDPGDFDRLSCLFRESSLFFMPSRQEAFGIVYAEASAFGLPSIAAATGGVPSVVWHGVNGLLLPVEADAAAYADAIGDLWRQPERYRTLQQGSARLYRETLNWSAWAAQVADIGLRLKAHGGRGSERG